MLTSKQRAKLRAMAHDYDSMLHIGKDGVTKTVIQQAEEVLSNRELIKVTVQKTAPEAVKDICYTLCDKTGSEAVQCIGRRFVIYRMAKEEDKRKIDLKKL